MTESWLITQMSNSSLQLLDDEDDGVAVVWARVGTWHPRKSKVIERRQRVLLDYVFVRPAELPRIKSELEHREHHISPLRTASGALIRVPSDVVDELMVRAEAGEFDQMPSRCRARRETEQRRLDLAEGSEVELTVSSLGVVRGVVLRSGSRVVLDTRTAMGRVTVRAEAVEGVLVN